MGTSSSVCVPLVVAVVFLCGAAGVFGADCEAIDSCHGMSPARTALIKSHIARNGFTRESCGHVLVAQALHYKPVDDCAHKESHVLVSKLRATCLANTLEALRPRPLCETHAQHTTSSLIGLQMAAIVTSAALSEWHVTARPHPGARPV